MKKPNINCNVIVKNTKNHVNYMDIKKKKSKILL